MKTIVSIACLMLLVVGATSVEARPKRSVLVYSSPIVAAPAVAVASVPVARSVVHSHPHTVVKTEQVHAGDHSSYSYEVRSHPVVHTHTQVASAPLVQHYTVPTYAHSYYPAAASYPAYYSSPYHYVVGK